MKKTLMTALFVIAAVFAFNTGAALAAPVLTLSQGSNTLTIVDQGIGDQNLLPNVVVYNGTFGTYSVDISTGLSMGTTLPFLNLTSTNFGTGALTVALSDTISPSADLNLLSTVGGNTGGSVEFSTLIDSTVVGSVMSANTMPFEVSTSGIVSAGTNTLTLQAVINHPTETLTGFNYNVRSVAVPEPASMLLLGSGLVGLGLFGRRRKA